MEFEKKPDKNAGKYGVHDWQNRWSRQKGLKLNFSSTPDLFWLTFPFNNVREEIDDSDNKANKQHHHLERFL